jgi:3-hydroxyisobutyrate dehydrogenase
VQGSLIGTIFETIYKTETDITMKDKVIGWIGTGLMGHPMVGHLLKAGYKVNVHSRTKSKADDLISQGCTWYDTPAALAANSDVVVTIIGFPKDVEECYFGPAGIFAGLKTGAILIDMTTTKPSLAVRISEQADRVGAEFVDAPVSGGQLGAINGNLSIMIGGKKEVVDRVAPIFETFGKNMVYQGKAGAGQHAKMCNQIIIAGTLIGVCEALIYGLKAGLDLNKMLESVSKGAAGCWSLDVLAPKIVKKDLSPGWKRRTRCSCPYRGWRSLNNYTYRYRRWEVGLMATRHYTWRSKNCLTWINIKRCR